jgi:hypothetical protein
MSDDLKKEAKELLHAAVRANALEETMAEGDARSRARRSEREQRVVEQVIALDPELARLDREMVKAHDAYLLYCRARAKDIGIVDKEQPYGVSLAHYIQNDLRKDSAWKLLDAAPYGGIASEMYETWKKATR